MTMRAGLLAVLLLVLVAALHRDGRERVVGPVSAEELSPARPATLAGRIVFVRADAGRNVLMAMRPDGSGQASLGVQGSKPDVSPDGQRVAYTTPRGDIAVLELAAGRETVLAADARAPRWSPDGRRIVFFRPGTAGSDIWVIAADGSNSVRLTDATGANYEADWSPDGTRIVFRRNTGDGGDLWTMRDDGSEAALLYAGEGTDQDPRWSPDGARIAFVRTVATAAGVTSRLYVIGADGSSPVQVAGPVGDVWSPVWSPDGSTIAFFAFRGADDPDLYTVRPDGRDLRVLLGGPQYDHGPAYGPAVRAARRASHDKEEK